MIEKKKVSQKISPIHIIHFQMYTATKVKLYFIYWNVVLFVIHKLIFFNISHELKLLNNVLFEKLFYFTNNYDE